MSRYPFNSTTQAHWAKADGTVSEVAPKNGKDFQLDELQKLVDGEGPHGKSDTITIVTLPGNRIMVANDDGLIIGLAHNRNATELYLEAGGASPIVGNVLICPAHMVR
jgi:hypothetical protein